MANNEHIDLVIASIKGELEATKGLGFDMGYLAHDTSCGTVACIAGHALAVNFKATTMKDILFAKGWYCFSPMGSAMEFLGVVDDDEACRLFMPDGHEDGIYSPSQAIKTLEYLKETGKVDWIAANPELATKETV